ncbi:MAG TPA: tetratricopeptide repeat protein, partial [Thiobacillaceae bacterium]|nr:tetratricopeptide repeat protein [Thiobacillaceae bacterium]
MSWHIDRLSYLLCALLLAGCSGKADPKALMAEAAKLEQAGNLNGALIQLKNAAQVHGDDKDVRLQLGQLYLTLEDYASAEKEFKRARQNGMDSSITDPLIARALIGQREYQRVVEEIPLPNRYQPGYSFLLAKRAQALVALGRKNEAAALLEQAKTQELQSADLSLSQAMLALADKKIDEAYAALEDGLKLDPKHLDSLVLKADLLHLMGKSAEAQAAYQAALAVNPRNLGSRLALAMIDIGNNRLVDARKTIDGVLKDSPRNLSAKYTLALIDFKEKKNPEARDQLTSVLKAAPNYLPAVLLSGAVEYSLGHLESAQNNLSKVLSANPNHV